MKLNKYDLEMKREGEINASEGLSSYVRALNFYTSTLVLGFIQVIVPLSFFNS